jgi:hypothetical protein
MGSGTDTKIDEQLMSNRPLVANRFENQDLLGRGGMGEVYRATEIQMEKLMKARKPQSFPQFFKPWPLYLLKIFYPMPGVEKDEYHCNHPIRPGFEDP